MELFLKEKFQLGIKEKMFDEMHIQKRKIGLREFAGNIGISASTLNRTIFGKTPDLETYFKYCKWMKRSTNEFYKH